MTKLLACLPALLLALITTHARAQFVQVPNTGCANAAYPATTGDLRVGTPFTVRTTCPRGVVSIFIVSFRRMPLQLPASLACSTGCTLLPEPELLWLGLFQWADTANRSWVGSTLYGQFACWNRTTNCIPLSGALQITFR